jgi:PIN domain nuclease of toxin-antitoxin system
VKFLLDTHTVLWALDSPELLGKRALNLMLDLRNELLVSLVIPWKIAIKANKHRQTPHALITDFHSVLQQLSFVSIGIDPLHAIRSGLLPFYHRDPFDRLLAAQSLELDIPLISRDTVFDQYGVKRIW